MSEERLSPREEKPCGFVRHFFWLFKNAFGGLPSFHSGYPAFLTKKMAEEEGFEPSESCPSAVFKTAALNHSTILPLIKAIFYSDLTRSSVTDFANPAGSSKGLPSVINA